MATEAPATSSICGWPVALLTVTSARRAAPKAYGSASPTSDGLTELGSLAACGGRTKQTARRT